LLATECHLTFQDSEIQSRAEGFADKIERCD